jgi:uncharacterized protein
MDYRKAVQDGYDGFSKGDPGPLFGLMDPKIEWTEAEGFPYAGTYVGPDAIANGVFAKLGSEWDGFSVSPDFIVVDADQAVSIGTYRGTYKATGKSFRARFAHVFTFSGDKLIRFEQVVDSAKVQEALSS